MDAPPLDVTFHGVVPSLGMCSLPGLTVNTLMEGVVRRDLDADIAQLSAQGVGVLVTLNETSELLRYGLSLEQFQAALARHKMEHVHFPIPDMKPPPIEGFSLCVDLIVARINKGRKVVVHCRLVPDCDDAMIVVTITFVGLVKVERAR
jgi:protein-tyrosine phosphatase